INDAACSPTPVSQLRAAEMIPSVARGSPRLRTRLTIAFPGGQLYLTGTTEADYGNSGLNVSPAIEGRMISVSRGRTSSVWSMVEEGGVFSMTSKAFLSRAWRVFVLGIFLPLVSMQGQTERGAITGTVSDASGAAVPGAEVRVTNIATNIHTSTTSTGTGTYRVTNLPPGIYNNASTKEGFKQAFIDNVRVLVSGSVTVYVSHEVVT